MILFNLVSLCLIAYQPISVIYAKPCLYIFFEYIRFSWVNFDGKSNFDGDSMPNPVYVNMLNI